MFFSPGLLKILSVVNACSNRTGHLLILRDPHWHSARVTSLATVRRTSGQLNPMDFAVWGYLQQKVSSKSHQSLNALKASLQKAWDDIDVTFLRPTVM
ncbi:unnamed protein product [Heligmosomoides polygyrus]|uniref:Mediator of RNA polymerase II transcription subunit 24 n=1 Tax=Heligmosomoides polygyrus TaxID=6339 RepID=A0A183G535_HELPZ|nr:unnamed protein product [Heligmosomoides polygyrus]